MNPNGISSDELSLKLLRRKSNSSEYQKYDLNFSFVIPVSVEAVSPSKLFIPHLDFNVEFVQKIFLISPYQKKISNAHSFKMLSTCEPS